MFLKINAHYLLLPLFLMSEVYFLWVEEIEYIGGPGIQQWRTFVDGVKLNQSQSE